MAAESDHSEISIDDFKAGMRQLAASVTIITVCYEGEQDGLTATAACSVSAKPVSYTHLTLPTKRIV